MPPPSGGQALTKNKRFSINKPAVKTAGILIIQWLLHQFNPVIIDFAHLGAGHFFYKGNFVGNGVLNKALLTQRQNLLAEFGFVVIIAVQRNNQLNIGFVFNLIRYGAGLVNVFQRTHEIFDFGGEDIDCVDF